MSETRLFRDPFGAESLVSISKRYGISAKNLYRLRANLIELVDPERDGVLVTDPTIVDLLERLGRIAATPYTYSNAPHANNLRLPSGECLLPAYWRFYSKAVTAYEVWIMHSLAAFGTYAQSYKRLAAFPEDYYIDKFIDEAIFLRAENAARAITLIA